MEKRQVKTWLSRPGQPDVRKCAQVFAGTRSDLVSRKPASDSNSNSTGLSDDMSDKSKAPTPSEISVEELDELAYRFSKTRLHHSFCIPPHLVEPLLAAARRALHSPSSAWRDMAERLLAQLIALEDFPDAAERRRARELIAEYALPPTPSLEKENERDRSSDADSGSVNRINVDTPVFMANPLAAPISESGECKHVWIETAPWPAGSPLWYRVKRKHCYKCKSQEITLLDEFSIDNLWNNLTPATEEERERWRKEGKPSPADKPVSEVEELVRRWELESCSDWGISVNTQSAGDDMMTALQRLTAENVKHLAAIRELRATLILPRNEAQAALAAKDAEIERLKHALAQTESHSQATPDDLATVS